MQLWRAKSKASSNPKPPRTYNEIMELLPEKYTLTSAGDPFLVYMGNVDGEEEFDGNDFHQLLLIYMSPFGRNLLSTSGTWLSNGTFKSAPKPFTQLYILFGEMSSGKVILSNIFLFLCLLFPSYVSYPFSPLSQSSYNILDRHCLLLGPFSQERTKKFIIVSGVSSR